MSKRNFTKDTSKFSRQIVLNISFRGVFKQLFIARVFFRSLGANGVAHLDAPHTGRALASRGVKGPFFLPAGFFATRLINLNL
jgi:hypothetical protein